MKAVVKPEFIWHSSDDPDSGYAIDYQVLSSSASDFADTVALSEATPETIWAGITALITIQLTLESFGFQWPCS